MGHRCDDAYDAERGEFLKANTICSADGVRLEKFDTRHEFKNLKLFNLVIKPAYLRLVEFHLAPRLGIVRRHFLDELHDGIAIIEAELGELFLSFRGGRDAVINFVEDAVLSRCD